MLHAAHGVFNTQASRPCEGHGRGGVPAHAPLARPSEDASPGNAETWQSLSCAASWGHLERVRVCVHMEDYLTVRSTGDDDGEAGRGKRPRLEHIAAVPRVVAQPLLLCAINEQHYHTPVPRMMP